jgi:hypothetical protein
MKLVTIQEREKSLKDEFERIVEVIKNEYAPEKIVLFGSLAADHVHELAIPCSLLQGHLIEGRV